MRDELDSRIWDRNHDRLATDIQALFVKVGEAFARLHRIQWSAPWRNGSAPDARRPGQA